MLLLVMVCMLIVIFVFMSDIQPDPKLNFEHHRIWHTYVKEFDLRGTDYNSHGFQSY